MVFRSVICVVRRAPGRQDPCKFNCILPGRSTLTNSSSAQKPMEGYWMRDSGWDGDGGQGHGWVVTSLQTFVGCSGADSLTCKAAEKLSGKVASQERGIADRQPSQTQKPAEDAVFIFSPNSLPKIVNRPHLPYSHSLYGANLSKIYTKIV